MGVKEGKVQFDCIKCPGKCSNKGKIKIIGFSSLVEKQTSPLCLLLIFGSKVWKINYCSLI